MNTNNYDDFRIDNIESMLEEHDDPIFVVCAKTIKDFRKNIYKEAYKAGQQEALDWVRQEVVGEDEEVLTSVSDMTYADENLIKNTVQKGIRNELRATQRQQLSEKKIKDNIES